MPEQTEQPTQKIYYDPISVAQRTTQLLHVVDTEDKPSMLAHILRNLEMLHVIVITKTKRDADALSAYLQAENIHAAALHSNKRAQDIDASKKAFSEGELTVLITTDMLLQSLEPSGLTHLVSYDLPLEPAHYVSRVGCLNEQGVSIALVSDEQSAELQAIERFMRYEMQEEEVEGYTGRAASEAALIPKPLKDQKKKPRHRSQKRKTGSKAKETDTTRPKDTRTE